MQVKGCRGAESALLWCVGAGVQEMRGTRAHLAPGLEGADIYFPGGLFPGEHPLLLLLLEGVVRLDMAGVWHGMVC